MEVNHCPRCGSTRITLNKTDRARNKPWYCLNFRFFAAPIRLTWDLVIDF